MQNYLMMARRALADLPQPSASVPRGGERCEISEISEISHDPAWHWTRITLIWPAALIVPTVKERWQRLDGGSIEAIYTRDELRLALAAAGVDLATLERT